jgi:hypothetical protein
VAGFARLGGLKRGGQLLRRCGVPREASAVAAREAEGGVGSLAGVGFRLAVARLRQHERVERGRQRAAWAELKDEPEGVRVVEGPQAVAHEGAALQRAEEKSSLGPKPLREVSFTGAEAGGVR